MLLNIKRIVVIIIFACLAVLFYFSEYSYEYETLQSSLTKKLDGFTVILDDYIIGDKLFVHFNYGGYRGVALLNKGLNNQYRLDDVYYSNKEIVFCSVDIGKEVYLLSFGPAKEPIKDLSVMGYNLTILNKHDLFSVDSLDMAIESIDTYIINGVEKSYTQVDYGDHTPDTFISHGNMAGGIFVTFIIPIFGCFAAYRLGKNKGQPWINRGPEQLTGPM